MNLIWISGDESHHWSHQMGDWESTIRAPSGTPRFYTVRKCKACGLEEGKHVAGHYIETGLEEPCLWDDTDAYNETFERP